MAQTMPLPAKAPSTSYLPELESLRGWAISGVLLFHFFGVLYGAKALESGAPIWLKWIAAGNTGVSLFFVLSGFLLGGQFISAIQAGRFPDVRRFLFMRALRILPLYYVAVLFAWLMSGNSEAFKALLFIPVGFSIFPYSVPWWSLSTEIQFYLLLPLFMYGCTLAAGRWLVLITLLFWLGLQFHLLHSAGWSQMYSAWDSSVFGRGLAFILGCGSAWLYSHARVRRCLEDNVLVNSIFITGLLALLMLLGWYGEAGQQQARIAFPLFHNLEALLWAVIVLCLLSSRLFAKRLWVNPLMNHFGKISYSLYLVHVPILFYFLYPVRVATSDRGLTFLSADVITPVALSLVVSWVAAMLCHYLIERPFLQLKQYWGQSRSRGLLGAV